MFMYFVAYSLPWFFSFSKERVAGMNISIKSGTLRMMQKAHRMAYKSNYSSDDQCNDCIHYVNIFFNNLSIDKSDVAHTETAES